MENIKEKLKYPEEVVFGPLLEVWVTLLCPWFSPVLGQYSAGQAVLRYFFELWPDFPNLRWNYVLLET